MIDVIHVKNRDAKIAAYGNLGSGAGSVVGAPDSWLKGRGFESLQQRRENFLLQGQLSVLTRSIPVLPQQHIKDPGHSAKSAGGRLQLNTHARMWLCMK